MRTILKIIGIFLLIAIVVVVGKWLSARRVAQQQGTTPLTFREFVTGKITTSNQGTTTTPGELSTEFTQNPSNSTQNSAQTRALQGTRVSTFTNTGTLTPTISSDQIGEGGISSGGTSGSTGTSGAGTSSAGGIQGQGTQTTTTPGGSGTSNQTAALPQCTQADLNITFTPQELARLQTLQRRFYAVAQTLRTDADAASELANHDSFKAKEQKITELYNYCQTKAPLLSQPELKRRIPTPFWRDASAGLGGYITQTAFPLSSGVNFSSAPQAEQATETILRINLW